MSKQQLIEKLSDTMDPGNAAAWVEELWQQAGREAIEEAQRRRPPAGAELAKYDGTFVKGVELVPPKAGHDACFGWLVKIDGVEVPEMRTFRFQAIAGEIPTMEFELNGLPIVNDLLQCVPIVYATVFPGYRMLIDRSSNVTKIQVEEDPEEPLPIVVRLRQQLADAHDLIRAFEAHEAYRKGERSDASGVAQEESLRDRSEESESPRAAEEQKGQEQGTAEPDRPSLRDC